MEEWKKLSVFDWIKKWLPKYRTALHKIRTASWNFKLDHPSLSLKKKYVAVQFCLEEKKKEEKEEEEEEEEEEDQGQIKTDIWLHCRKQSESYNER